MKRYVAIRAIPSSWWEYHATYNGRSSIDVLVTEKKAERTGLIDASGNDLYRLPADRPAGFTAKWSDDD